MSFPFPIPSINFFPNLKPLLLADFFIAAYFFFSVTLDIVICVFSAVRRVGRPFHGRDVEIVGSEEGSEDGSEDGSKVEDRDPLHGDDSY